MTWNIVLRRPFRLCVPFAATGARLTLERVYPSRMVVGDLEEVLPRLYCREVRPGDNIVEAYRVVTGDGGVVDVATFHYYVDVPPSNIDTIVVVSKEPGDVVSGELIGASTGERLGDINFEDRNDIAIGYVRLPRRGLYYGLIYIRDGVFVEELFFRRRVNLALRALVYTIAIMPSRRVVILG